MTSQPLPSHDADPVVRFRLRALIALTTGLAFLAAIAGPYYRRQSPEVQPLLLVYWCCVLLCAALALWHHWRTGWRIPESMGHVRYVLWSGSRGGRFFRGRTGLILVAAMWIAFIAGESHMVVNQATRSNASPTIWRAFFPGCFHGLMTGGMIVAFVRRPVFLTDKAVWHAGAWGPWKYICDAQWMSDRRHVLKLHRLDGNFYVDVPERLRSEVEAFVREKATFIEPTNPPQPLSARSVAGG